MIGDTNLEGIHTTTVITEFCFILATNGAYGAFLKRSLYVAVWMENAIFQNADGMART